MTAATNPNVAVKPAGKAAFKVVGKAVAEARGHYPRPEGGSRIIAPGETFDVFEGLTKARWFKMVEQPKAKKPEGGDKPAGDKPAGDKSAGDKPAGDLA